LVMHVIKITDEFLGMHIAELGMPVRVLNQLEGEGVNTVLELLYCCGRSMSCLECDKKGCAIDVKLMAIDNFGKKHLSLVFEALHRVSEEVYNGQTI